MLPYASVNKMFLNGFCPKGLNFLAPKPFWV